MYNTVKARVRVNGDLTDVFLCPQGLKQGEVCSPVLFSLFINELTKDITISGIHGVQLSPDFIQLLILLFADDVALISDSVGGLQTQLNILCNTAKRLELVVNMDKSNIVIFRNGGYRALREKWVFDGNDLKVVNMYKYLGIYLSTRLSFVYTMSDLAERAKKGTVAIIRMLWSIGEYSPATFFKLFDCQIQPILTYGSEIWGLTKNQEIIERVHLFALRRFLGANPKAPKHLIYSETGRYPIFVATHIKCIKFWFRLIQMDNTKYPKKAYDMLLNLQSHNYDTWACKVRNTLYRYGFGHVWEAQGVGHLNMFITILRQRLIDCFEQDWHAGLESHSFFDVYSSFKQTISISCHLNIITNIKLRNVMSRFRIGMSPLKCHFLQYTPKSNRELYCPFCTNVRETEMHFVLCCHKYENLRKELIPAKYYRLPSMFKFSLLLACENKVIVNRLSLFVSKALKLRHECMLMN